MRGLLYKTTPKREECFGSQCSFFNFDSEYFNEASGQMLQLLSRDFRELGGIVELILICFQPGSERKKRGHNGHVFNMLGYLTIGASQAKNPPIDLDTN